MRSDTAFFSAADISRRFLAGLASDLLSAAAAAVGGGEEERRDVERAFGADAPRICSTSVNALISAWRRSISLWRLAIACAISFMALESSDPAMGMSTRGGGRRVCHGTAATAAGRGGVVLLEGDLGERPGRSPRTSVPVPPAVAGERSGLAEAAGRARRRRGRGVAASRDDLQAEGLGRTARLARRPASRRGSRARRHRRSRDVSAVTSHVDPPPADPAEQDLCRAADAVAYPAGDVELAGKELQRRRTRHHG